MPEILKGHHVAEDLRIKTKEKVKKLTDQGIIPTLAFMRADENPASIKYEEAAARFMDKVGIQTVHVNFTPEVPEDIFLQELEKLNQDEDVHGILVLQPLPENISLKAVADCISPKKDIDGMHALNLGKIMLGDSSGHLPSTVKAVVELLQYYKINVAGKNVCVIGKSNTVGKPLSVSLLTQGATVSTCHTETNNLKQFTKQADILVTATGEIGLVTKEHVKENAVVIDVGFNFEKGKAYGDVLYDEVVNVASAITPVPGGVGSVTTASLADQVANAAEWVQEE